MKTFYLFDYISVLNIDLNFLFSLCLLHYYIANKPILSFFFFCLVYAGA